MKGSKAPAKKAKDLSPKSGGVKGGGGGIDTKIATNDNLTLLRVAGATKKAKDLPPKSGEVKGGGKRLNDNMTLVRAAKPTAKKKDLPARKDVKGGKKIA